LIILIKLLGIDKLNLTRLIKFGQRNCTRFLSSPAFWPPPAFGLVHFSRLLGNISENVPSEKEIEDKIEFLRKWALQEGEPEAVANTIIRYRDKQSAKYFCKNIAHRFRPSAQAPANRLRL
jgi:hypothetical protein